MMEVCFPERVVTDTLFFDRKRFGRNFGGRRRSHGSGAGQRSAGKRKLEQCVRVHAGAIEFDAPVQMRTCGTAGGSHLADDLPRLYEISLFHENL